MHYLHAKNKKKLIMGWRKPLERSEAAPTEIFLYAHGVGTVPMRHNLHSFVSLNFRFRLLSDDRSGISLSCACPHIRLLRVRNVPLHLCYLDTRDKISRCWPFFSSPPPLAPAQHHPSPFFSVWAHEIFSRNLSAVDAERTGETPPQNMATIVTSTRFTDEYQLYEELGKYAATALFSSPCCVHVIALTSTGALFMSETGKAAEQSEKLATHSPVQTAVHLSGIPIFISVMIQLLVGCILVSDHLLIVALGSLHVHIGLRVLVAQNILYLSIFMQQEALPDEGSRETPYPFKNTTTFSLSITVIYGDSFVFFVAMKIVSRYTLFVKRIGAHWAT